jgi:hypothetical protein
MSRERDMEGNNFVGQLACLVNGIRRNYLLHYEVQANIIWIHSELFGSNSMKVIPKLQISEISDEPQSNIYRYDVIFLS